MTELRPVPGIPASDLLSGALIAILEPDLGESDRSDKVDKWARRLKTRDDYPVTLRSRVLARADGAGHVLFVDRPPTEGGEPAAPSPLTAPDTQEGDGTGYGLGLRACRT